MSNKNMYNEKYYQNGKMLQLKPKAEAIHTFKTSDGTLIAIFQGSRGDNPKLDFRVKYLDNEPNAKPVMLPHIDWVVDLIIKAQKYPNEVEKILDYFINFYNSCKPFSTVEERATYSPITKTDIEGMYSHVQVPGTLSIGGIAIILELFCICEKQTANAHQFKQLLHDMRDYIRGNINYRKLLNLAIKHW
jgi:hypothetical protein